MVSRNPALSMKITIANILLCSLLLFTGCAEFKYNDEDRKLFLRQSYNTADVRLYKFSSECTRWLVRTRSGEVLVVTLTTKDGRLAVGSSDTIFSTLRE